MALAGHVGGNVRLAEYQTTRGKPTKHLMSDDEAKKRHHSTQIEDTRGWECEETRVGESLSTL